MFGPLGGCLRLVESLPGDGLADDYTEGLVAVLEHFVGQIEHGDVELDAQPLAPIAHPSESCRKSVGNMSDFSRGFR